MNPTHEQLSAAHGGGQRTVIIAPAGSGKTSVLAARAAAVCDRRSSVLGSRPLCTSFTVKATAEIKARAPMAQAFTLHGLCRHLKTLLESDPFTVYDQTDADDVACLAGEDCGVLVLGGYKDKRKAATKVLKSEAGRRRYLELLRQSRAVDYETLVDDGLRHAARPSVHDVFSATHFLIDEAQDLDPKQRQLVESIAPAAVTLILDPRQQIFAFRGGSAEWGLSAWESAGWSRFALTHNFRSVPAVVDLGNRIARKMPFEAPEMVAARPEGLPVMLGAFESSEAEAESVASWARIEAETWESGPPAVFILGRTWSALQRTREAMEAAGTPHLYLGSRGDFWQSEAVRMVLRGASLVLNPWQDHWARLVANWPVPTLTPAELARGAEWCARNDEPLGRWLSGNRDSLDWLDNCDVRKASERSATAAIALIVTVWGCAHTLRATGRGTKAADVAALEDRVREWEATAEDKSLAALLGWRAEATAADEMEEAPVVVASIHAVKGLEASSVAVVGMDATFTDKTEEDRRLAFVAVTRARDRLLLTRSTTKRGEPVGPSAFWTEANGWAQ